MSAGATRTRSPRGWNNREGAERDMNSRHCAVESLVPMNEPRTRCAPSQPKSDLSDFGPVLRPKSGKPEFGCLRREGRGEGGSAHARCLENPHHAPAARAFVFALVSFAASAMPASAQSDFYRGKTINLMVGSG